MEDLPGVDEGQKGNDRRSGRDGGVEQVGKVKFEAKRESKPQLSGAVHKGDQQNNNTRGEIRSAEIGGDRFSNGLGRPAIGGGQQQTFCSAKSEKLFGFMPLVNIYPQLAGGCDERRQWASGSSGHVSIASNVQPNRKRH